MNQTKTNHERRGSDLKRVLDPFGIADALGEVQRAWLEHPQELTGELMRYGREFFELNLRLANPALLTGRGVPLSEASREDERFAEPEWSQLPAFAALKEHYLHVTHWLEDAIYRTPGAPSRIKRRAAYWVRQWLNAIAPTNYFLTNPVAVRRFWETGGQSLVQGARNLIDDVRVGDVQMVDRSAFRVGENLATTPGAVVFRNRLLEVIHYRPAGARVHAIPLVIVAPWINKYYILDLNEKKSLIRHLVSHGFDVYVTSWRNPGPELAEVTYDEYMIDGVLAAIEVAREVSGAQRVHAVGYCLGGTTLAALMAWLNRKHERSEDVPVAHWTLFASLVDFSRPGAIEVFIGPDSVEFLEELMRAQGYLDGREMARAFRMLRSNSLIWHYVVHGYLYGEAPPAFDVLYWNADTTRLPRAMHSFYLREFYLENRLTKKDGVTLAGLPIDLRRIRQPLYAVGCEEDHIAPWKAAFDICARTGGPVRFVLSSSGHILGIVNPPVKPPRRNYWVGDARGQANAEDWRHARERRAGSWWEDWVPWLARHCGPLKEPPPLATRKHPKLADAPGTYVLEP
ncbi:MAG: PHA/PHB synthase family protein [Pseudomonadota bacterium]